MLDLARHGAEVQVAGERWQGLAALTPPGRQCYTAGVTTTINPPLSTTTIPRERYYHNAEKKVLLAVPRHGSCMSITQPSKGKEPHYYLWADVDVTRADNYYVDVGEHTFYNTTRRIESTSRLSGPKREALKWFEDAYLGHEPEYGQEIDEAEYKRLRAEYLAQVAKNQAPGAAVAAPTETREAPRRRAR